MKDVAIDEEARPLEPGSDRCREVASNGRDSSVSISRQPGNGNVDLARLRKVMLGTVCDLDAARVRINEIQESVEISRKISARAEEIARYANGISKTTGKLLDFTSEDVKLIFECLGAEQDDFSFFLRMICALFDRVRQIEDAVVDHLHDDLGRAILPETEAAALADQSSHVEPEEEGS